MNKRILFGTTNPAKKQHIQKILHTLPLDILSLKDLKVEVLVIEDGSTPEENARKKAKIYHIESGIPTFAIDSGLIIERFSNAKQPRVFVRRIQGAGHQITDEKIIEHYTNALNDVGGESIGTWYNCIALAISKDEIFAQSSSLKTRFTSEGSRVLTPGAPLNSLMTDPVSGQYYSEMTYEERPDTRVIVEFLR